MRSNKMLSFIVTVSVAVVLAWLRFAGPVTDSTGSSSVSEAFRAHRSGIVIETVGQVSRILGDDTEGSRHQRFIIEVEPGLTVLISHNIDLAPRAPVSVGDRVEVRGQYEWNEQGGVVHWTHHDPQGQRVGGWIRHDGSEYR